MWDLMLENPTAGGPKRVLRGHKGPVSSIAYIPKPIDVLVSISVDAQLIVWSPHGPVYQVHWLTSAGPLHSLSFNPQRHTVSGKAAPPPAAPRRRGSRARAQPGKLAPAGTAPSRDGTGSQSPPRPLASRS